MTPTGNDRAALAAIVTRTRYLLLDFDGPVCSIFAGLPAPTVAEELRKLFTPDHLTDTAKNTTDPIEVFIQAAEADPELAARVEAEMTAQEVAAVATAEAAHSAGIGSIGYANKAGKREAMTDLHAGAVIASMADLALSLRANSRAI